MLSTVRSEKTTPQPKVTPGGFRSNTSISCAASRSFIVIAKYRPAGPAPTQAIFIALAWHSSAALGQRETSWGLDQDSLGTKRAASIRSRRPPETWELNLRANRAFERSTASRSDSSRKAG